MIKMITLVLVNCILLVSGQILWKIGLNKVEINNKKEILTLLFNKYIFLGLVIYGMATLFWFYILKKYPLNKVYPLQSFSYILAIFSSYIFFQETITVWNIIGAFVIMVGVGIIALN